MKHVRTSFLLWLMLIVLLTPPDARPQSLDSLYSYYPMHVGDEWQYDYIDVITSQHVSYKRVQIVSDTMLGSGVKYFVCVDSGPLPGYSVIYSSLQRIDSTTGDVLRALDSTHEAVLYRLSEPQHFADVDTLWGVITPTITLDYIDYWPRFAYGFGLVSFQYMPGSWPYLATLKFARINGTEYGQPVLSAIKEVTLPDRFILRQNYPNPFNPSTKISFYLRNASYTTLRVYDPLGRLVRTLLARHEGQGNHEVVFDATSLSSGIYFYQLQTGAGTVAKSMVLVR